MRRKKDSIKRHPGFELFWMLPYDTRCSLIRNGTPTQAMVNEICKTWYNETGLTNLYKFLNGVD